MENKKKNLIKSIEFVENVLSQYTLDDLKLFAKVVEQKRDKLNRSSFL